MIQIWACESIILIIIKRTFPGGPVVKTPNCCLNIDGGPGLLPCQETRSCMPQLRPGAVKKIIKIMLIGSTEVHSKCLIYLMILILIRT